MAEQGTATKPTHIDNKFAASERELYGNKPFHGAILRLRNGQPAMFDHINKQDRLTLPKWLEQKNIDQGQFILETEDADGNPLSFDFVIDKNGDSAKESPFYRNMPTQQNSSSAVKDELEAQVLRLKNEVEESTRKRREAEEDLFKYKKENTDETGDLKEEHRKEVDQLKENHRQQKDKLKEEIRKKDWEIKLKEVELMNENGSPSGWDKVVDKFLNDDFLSNITTQVAKMMQQQGNAQPTPQQLKEAARQQMQTQFEDKNGAQAESTRKNPAQNGQPQPTGDPQAPTQQQPQQITPEQFKMNFLRNLPSAAVEALTASNPALEKYKKAVNSQIDLLKNQNISIDAAQWVEMAKMLADKAVKEEITPNRVAKVLNPLLQNLPLKAKMAFNTLKPETAANVLFEMYGVEVNPTVKEMVVKVLTVLKKGEQNK